MGQGRLRSFLQFRYRSMDDMGHNCIVSFLEAEQALLTFPSVTTVFDLLKKEIAGYTVDKVAARTGLPAHEIELFAKELGTRKPAMIIHGAGTNHWFHNDLSNRSLILLVALTGNTGKNGGGFNHYVGQERVWPEQGFFKLAFPETRKKQRFQNTTLWSYVHSTNKDPHLYNGKPIEWYIQESVKNGWMPLWPKNGKKPRAFIVWRANYLNQAKGNEILESSLWKDLDLIVDINYRMDTTALYSDVVLPAASYYEKVDINTTDCHSYILLIAFVMVLTLSFLWPSAITPGAWWKPQAGGNPTRDVTAIILVSAGLPFFVLSTTGPLLQRWFARLGGGLGTYKLYSISNLGSLLGLLTFPFLLEPTLRMKTQGTFWSVLFWGFVGGCGVCAWKARNAIEETPDRRKHSRRHCRNSNQRAHLCAMVPAGCLPIFAAVGHYQPALPGSDDSSAALGIATFSLSSQLHSVL